MTIDFYAKPDRSLNNMFQAYRDLLKSRTDANRLPSGAATEAHTAQLSPRAEVEAIQADTRRIAEIREEMEAEVWVVCSGCGCEKIAGTKCDNCDDIRGRETDLDMCDDYDPEAFYDHRGRLVAEDPDADYDAEYKYAEVD